MLKRVRIDGDILHCVSRKEAKAVAAQIEKYFRNGITLDTESVVLDVGANIGLFSRYVLRKIEKSARVFAFEPIPVLFRALGENTREFTNIRTFQIGFADYNGNGRFSFFKNASSISTLYKQDRPRDLLEPVLSTMDNPDSDFYKYRSMKLLPRAVLHPFIKRTLRNVLHPEDIHAPLRTLSGFIDEEGIERIDLLKIDVEKSEMDVLNGITDDHLSAVRQIVMEVHDIDGRKKKIEERLRANGFGHIISEKDQTVPAVEDIFMLYAVKKK